VDHLQKQHYLRLHECKAAPSSYEVIPIHNILGKVALMPDCVTPTIPRHHEHQRKRAFPRGEVGCKVFYVNHFALTWARSKIILGRCISEPDTCCAHSCFAGSHTESKLLLQGKKSNPPFRIGRFIVTLRDVFFRRRRARRHARLSRVSCVLCCMFACLTVSYAYTLCVEGCVSSQTCSCAKPSQKPRNRRDFPQTC